MCRVDEDQLALLVLPQVVASSTGLATANTCSRVSSMPCSLRACSVHAATMSSSPPGISTRTHIPQTIPIGIPEFATPCRSDTDRACAGCRAAEVGNSAARMAELEGGSAALGKACAPVDLDRR